MRIEYSVLFAAAALSGCVSHSTTRDVRNVQQLVSQERASVVSGEAAPLRRAADRLPAGDAVDADVGQLLAAPLTVEGAMRVAILNNRELRADLLSLGVARGQLVQADLFPNPEFEVDMRASEDRSQGRQWDLGVGLDLTHIILRPERKGVAEAVLESARLRAASAVLDLGYRVRLAYYAVQAAEQRLELQNTALQAFAASYDTARALHEAGNTTDLALSIEQSAYEGAREAAAEADVALQDARERLNSLLGLYGQDVNWKAVSQLDEPKRELSNLERLESRAIEASLDLARLRSEVNAAVRRVGLTETAGWLPELNLGVHAEHDGRHWEAGPSLVGSLPLFDRRQGDLISLQAELDAQRQRYLANAVGIRAAVRSARARALSAEARVRHYRQTLLPLREQLVQQTVLEYNAMQVGVFQLLQARRDQLEAASGYVNVLHEYWRARAALEQLLAGRMATLNDSPAPREMSTSRGESSVAH